jgi:hypothetical protein
MTLSAIPEVVGVAILRPPVMRLLFADGVVRDVQYVPGEAQGSLIVPLDDPEYFAKVSVDSDAGTVVWPNGLDLALIDGLDSRPSSGCDLLLLLFPAHPVSNWRTKARLEDRRTEPPTSLGALRSSARPNAPR